MVAKMMIPKTRPEYNIDLIKGQYFTWFLEHMHLPLQERLDKFEAETGYCISVKQGATYFTFKKPEDETAFLLKVASIPSMQRVPLKKEIEYEE